MGPDGCNKAADLYSVLSAKDGAEEFVRLLDEAKRFRGGKPRRWQRDQVW